MKKLTVGLLFTLSIFASGAVFGQSFKSNIALADDAFAQRNFYTAAMYYQLVFNELEQPDAVAYPYKRGSGVKKNEAFQVYQYVIGRLAECYYNYHDFKNAEKWYAKISALEEFKDLKSTMNYGSSLRANMKYDESYIIYKKAKYMHAPVYVTNDRGVKVETEESKQISRRITFELACAKFGEQAMLKKTNSDPEKMDTAKVNRKTESSYASARMMNDKVMFTSTRFKIDNPTSTRVGDYANTFLTYHLFDSTLIKVDFGFGIDRNVASPSFTADQKFMYFTSWSAEPEKSTYQIFMSKPLNDSIWEEAKLLPAVVNLPESRNIHPYVTKDGKGLYFASDRKDGFGGLDIYYVRLDEKGWPTGQAQNLGPNINSEGDDQTPWFDEPSQTLFYSSNGWIGMGGFDMFFACKKYEQWSLPTNLGYPLNSSKDDAYMSTAENTNIAFFSSDRDNDCCFELYTVELNLYTAKGQVVDANDGHPLSNVKIKLTNQIGGNEIKTIYTDDFGWYYFPLLKGVNYNATYEKLGYLDNDLQFTTETAVPRDTMLLPVVRMLTTEIGKAVALDEIFYDFGLATIRPESYPVLDKLARNLIKFPYLLIEIGSHTDNVGSDEFNIDLSNRRSQSVVNYLVGQGVRRASITSRGYGENQPKVANENPDGSDNPLNRQINRRTEFKVLEYDVEKLQ